MTNKNNYFLLPAHEEIARARYYRKGPDGEPIENSIEEVFQRETDYIFQNDLEYKEEAFKLRLEKKILPAGRPLAQAGTDTKSLFNCFVLAFDDDSREAISKLKSRHLNIQAMGGGVGVNFSNLRPRGSVCKTVQARSSGSVGFLNDLSYQAFNVQQGGNRSGANLGLLDCSHPDLLDFISYKSTHNWENIRRWSRITSEDEFAYFQWSIPYPWQMFNVSVALTDKFMSQVLSDSEQPWKLQWKEQEWPLWDFLIQKGPATKKEYLKQVTITAPTKEIAFYKAGTKVPFFRTKDLELTLDKGPYHLTAKEWLKLISQHAHQDGCPGVIFIDTIRKYHNGEYKYPISCTNPCGEEPLPASGNCCLSTVVLPSFFKDNEFNFSEFKQSIQSVIRSLDNMISLNHTKDIEIDALTKEQRRIGLSTTGAAELLLLKGLKYSSVEAREYLSNILEFMRNVAYNTSIDLAIERGPFPGFDFSGYSKSLFFTRLPKDIQERIKKHGIRNVTIISQAPIGSTGTMIGYSTGCEPYFAMAYMRNSRIGSFLDGSPCFRQWLENNKINYEDFNYSLAELRKTYNVPDYFEEAHEISPENHLAMMQVFTTFNDASCSKTVNLSTESTVENIQSLYIEAYTLGIKCVSVYRDGSKQQILEHIKKDSRAKDIIPSSAPQRPSVLNCDIHTTSVKGEKWTVLVGLLDGKPYEVFCAPQESFEISQKYKTGKLIKKAKSTYLLDLEDFKVKNLSSLLATDEHRVITRLLSMALRHGIPVEYVADQLGKVEGSAVDISKAIMRVLRKYTKEEEELKGAEALCPSCKKESMIRIEGCSSCKDCGYSKCS